MIVFLALFVIFSLDVFGCLGLWGPSFPLKGVSAEASGLDEAQSGQTAQKLGR